MVRRIVIAGYYGFGNGGDELILFSLLNDLKRLGSKIEICVLSAHPSETSKIYRVKAINRWNPLSVAVAIFHTDLFVFGGGGLLQDLTSTWSIYYYLGLILLAKLFFKKVFLISQGVGPIRKKINRKVTGIVLGLVDGITARDKLSECELRKLNRDLLVCIVPDPVLNLDRITLTTGPGLCPPLPLSEGRGSLPNERPIVGVCLQGLGKDERFKQIIRETCDELARKITSRVIFIPFHKLEDLKISKEIIANKTNGYHLFLWGDVRDLFEIYKKIDLILGMRLHSIILACLLNKPFLAISFPRTHPLYDPKVESFLEALGYDSIDMAIPAQEIVKKVQEIWANRQKLVEELDVRITKLREISRKSVELIQRLLENVE